jgi:dTDP-4-amino-4,6-dideoxygalactose transaminase
MRQSLGKLFSRVRLFFNYLRLFFNNRRWRNEGVYVKRFENEIKKLTNSEWATTVTNGTSGLEAVLRSIELRSDNEVVLPIISFYSTLSSILISNGKPVFVDVDERTGVLNTKSLKNNISSKTKALILVSIGGYRFTDDYLKEVRKIVGSEVVLIEDAAHRNVANYVMNPIIDHSVFSFQNAKLHSAGEGGLILSNNVSNGQKVFLYTNCGRSDRIGDYNHVKLGTNSRMTEMQAILLLRNLYKATNIHVHRKAKNVLIKRGVYYGDDFQSDQYFLPVKKNSLKSSLLKDPYPLLNKLAFYEILLKSQNTSYPGADAYRDNVQWLMHSDYKKFIKEMK